MIKSAPAGHPRPVPAQPTPLTPETGMIMNATLTTPRGSKIKTATQRRYVIIGEDVNVSTGRARHAWIYKRSDNRDTARTHRDRAASAAYPYLNQISRYVIMDTTTGEAVR